MSNDIPLNARDYIAPKYWGLWLVFGIMRLSTYLPMKWTQAIGSSIGRLGYRLVASRRRVARINIRQAYPDYSEEQIRQLNREHFRSLGISFFEMGLAWWGKTDKLRAASTVEGMHHLEKAAAKGKGVVLLTGHFTTLDIGARLVGTHTVFDKKYKHYTYNGVYKKAHNRFFNAMMAHCRAYYGTELIENTNVRAVIRGLRKGAITWFAPDQDFSQQDIVFTPFLGGIASTLTATARMSEMTNAPVVPYYPERLKNGKGYKLVILPALENFPTGDIEQDSARINKAIEEMAYANPSQYGWVHKRFKTQPPGSPPVYQ
jgi:KDO2-lipid IV(A) lauroyltransferase